MRGQKHLLKSINRRKPAHGHSHQQPQPSQGQNSVAACVEVGKFGLEEEVERLKRDKNVLMQELIKLRQQQQSTDNQLQAMVQRLQGMEQRQQQMMSFLAKAVQSPSFLTQFVQQQNESNRRIIEVNKKRRLKQDEGGDSGTPDGQIVKYQPPVNEAAKAMLRQIMTTDTSSRLESFNDTHDNILTGNGSSSSSSLIDSGSSSSRASGVTLQEVPLTSGLGSSSAISEVQSSLQAANSGTVTRAPFSDINALVGAQEAQSIPISQAGVIIPELSQIPEMVPECLVDIPEENMAPDAGVGFIENMASDAGDGFISDILGLDGSMTIDIDSIPPDPDIEALLKNWDQFLQSPEPDEMDSTSAEGVPMGNEEQPSTENGWDKTQHNMDNLTEKMGRLTSDTKGV